MVKFSKVSEKKLMAVIKEMVKKLDIAGSNGTYDIYGAVFQEQEKAKEMEKWWKEYQKSL